MTFRIDVQALRKQAANAARAANLLTPRPEISNLASLAAQTDLECVSQEWSHAEINSFSAHHARLCALGFTADQADALAERLAMRKRTADDRTVCAVDCLNYRNGRCQRSVCSGLANPLGDLAFMLQRCPAAVMKPTSEGEPVKTLNKSEDLNDD